MLARIAFFVSGGAFFLIYGGFAAALSALARILGRRDLKLAADAENCALPSMCVYLSALNEADAIEERLANILDTTYPIAGVQIIVVSDGSTDDTAHRARAFAERHPLVDILVIEQPERRGQAAAQNLVVEVSGAEVLVSTDADARFVPETLSALAQPFGDAEVGVVGGRVGYDTPVHNALGRAYNSYRRMEWSLRRVEESLGVLVKVDGPCVAYRRALWSPIEDFEDVDQVITLMARKQGFSCVQAEDAVCFDRANQRADQEVRQRRRMTRKALLSTFNQWGWRDAVANPGFTLTLFCHKILRFFSPVFCLTLTLSATTLLARRRLLWTTIPISTLVVVVVGPLRRTVSAFLVAQAAFAAGIFDWLRGDRGGSYVPTRRISGGEPTTPEGKRRTRLCTAARSVRQGPNRAEKVFATWVSRRSSR